jgi:hypothetical protein
MSNEFRICNICKLSKLTTEFKNNNKGCESCLTKRKEKYTTKIRPKFYKSSQPPTDTDENFSCVRCKKVFPISSFTDDNGDLRKCCSYCRQAVKNNYKEKTKDIEKIKPQVIHCECCNKDIVDYLYNFHLSSKAHKYREEKMQALTKEVKLTTDLIDKYQNALIEENE